MNKVKGVVGHHIIQRTHGGSNHPQNIHYRPVAFERAYHTIFEDNLPIDRIQRILNLDSQAYNPDVVRDINSLLDTVRKEWADAYDYRCLKGNNIFTKGK